MEWVDDERVGFTPVTLTLDAGLHTIGILVPVPSFGFPYWRVKEWRDETGAVMSRNLIVKVLLSNLVMPYR
jgi:hypothetical protein